MSKFNDNPNHTVSEEERFNSDFYSYLEQPENMTRYTLSLDFLDRCFNKKYDVLDVGCGNAAIAKYVSNKCMYEGVDHSRSAIDYCKSLYPVYNFYTDDIENFIKNSNKRYDVIIMCGFLFHTVDKEDLTKKNDEVIVLTCIKNLLKEDGYFVIIAPFSFRSNEKYSMIKQAEWKLKSVENNVSFLKKVPVFQGISIQHGIEKKVRNQKMIPDWFLSDPNDNLNNRFSGTYLAAWTLIYK